jgi:glycosyltransferase involved in cell wall biosynthesis
MNQSAPVRILMTSDTVGGVWTYATSLASALAAMDAEVYLVTMGPAAHGAKRGMLRDERVRLIESPLALEWQDPAGGDLLSARQCLEDLEDAIQPDIVHLNSFREANFDWLAPVVVVTHSCVNSWGLACNDTAWLSDPKWQRYTQAAVTGLNKAQAWVSPSRAFHDVISGLYRPSSPGTVIWNGVTPATSSVSEKRRFILAAGRIWDSAKNIATLARASRGLDWPVLVAGPTLGSHLDNVNGVTLIGDLTHDGLRKHMQHAAIFVSPARYEPFGLSVLEAASRGCALVLSDIPTFRELWDGAALFVNANDGDGLRHALAALCRDDGERARLQAAALKRSQRFSLAQTATAYRTLYQTLRTFYPRAASSRATEVHA